MEEEKLRAVYYARCSTEEENQKDALVRQAAEEHREMLFWTKEDFYEFLSSYFSPFYVILKTSLLSQFFKQEVVTQSNSVMNNPFIFVQCLFKQFL